jgi:hypothetical protein
MLDGTGKVVPRHADAGGGGGSEGIAPHILNLGIYGDEWLASRPSHFTTNEITRVPTG